MHLKDISLDSNNGIDNIADLLLIIGMHTSVGICIYVLAKSAIPFGYYARNDMRAFFNTLLNCLVLQHVELFGICAQTERKHLDAYNFPLCVIVENHAGLYLFGFDDCRFV